MQGRGVRYLVKHSGEFLYKLSNEEDIDRYKLTKIRMPHEIKEPRVKLEASSVVRDDDKADLEVVDVSQGSARLGKTNELAPVSSYLTEREKYLLPIGKAGSKDPVTGLSDHTTIYEAEDDEQVLEFEVFKNYITMIVEKNGQRQLKSISL